MGWDDWRVGVEYDGTRHWTDPEIRGHDIDSQAQLEALGWRIVRVGADMLRYRHNTIVARTQGSLTCRGRAPLSGQTRLPSEESPEPRTVRHVRRKVLTRPPTSS